MNELLESLINEELADTSLYAGEAKLFADKLAGGERIANVFAAFAAEEHEHAQALMAIAGVKETAPSRDIPAGGSLKLSLEMHARREATGLIIYNKILELLTEPAHKMIVKGIIAQESEHLRAVKDYLQKIRGAND